jgi:hypothetical protein
LVKFRINRILGCTIFITGVLLLHQCKAGKNLILPSAPHAGANNWETRCLAVDTIHSFLISNVEAILNYEDERYEVTLTLYSRKDSILYISAVNSGYEIIRASVDHDTIRVIDRLNKVVYRTPLYRKFGYQFPVNFEDLQHISSLYYLCGEDRIGEIPKDEKVILEYDMPSIKKRISLSKNGQQMDIFEFYHQKTGQYLMGEKVEGGYKIYSNLMVAKFEIIARGGSLVFNRDLEVKMDVNPRRYSFIDLQ